MKKLILILLLMLPFTADAQVQPQVGRNNMGQPIIRFVNLYYRPVSCFYKDAYSYYTFTILPQSYSMWYPIYGNYSWNCR